METYISFVNTRDAGVSSKHSHMNLQKIPFHRNLTNFFEFWSSGKLRYESFRSRFHIQSPFYIKCFNWERLSVLKWRKKQTGSKCLNWLQGNSLHLFSSQGISCSENPLEQVICIAPFLNIFFNFKSTRAICSWFILKKCGTFC